MRICVDLKVHINDRIIDEDHPITDMRQSSTTYMGPHSFAKLISQMSRHKICAQSAHLLN